MDLFNNVPPDVYTNALPTNVFFKDVLISIFTGFFTDVAPTDVSFTEVLFRVFTNILTDVFTDW